MFQAVGVKWAHSACNQMTFPATKSTPWIKQEELSDLITVLQKFKCFLSTTVETQSSHWWFIDYFRHHIIASLLLALNLWWRYGHDLEVCLGHAHEWYVKDNKSITL